MRNRWSETEVCESCRITLCGDPDLVLGSKKLRELFLFFLRENHMQVLLTFSTDFVSSKRTYYSRIVVERR